MPKKNIFSSVLMGATLLLPLLLLSCDKLCKDEELKLKRTEYIGTQLRTDGYYYGNIDTSGETKWAGIHYFYRDGIHKHIGARLLDEANAGIILPDNQPEMKSVWGVFLVDGGEIEIESWGSGQCGLTRYYEKGEILNDTTFVITYYETHKGRRMENNDVHRVYYFRQAEKPDSTNNYIN